MRFHALAVAAVSAVGLGVYPAQAVPISQVALMGQPAPGHAVGVSFGGFDNAPVIRSIGQVGGIVALSGGDITLANNESIWVGPVGGFTQVARESEPAPGTAASFGSLLRPTVNAAGELAFAGLVSGPGVSANSDTAIWLGPAGGLQLLAREGDAAPGTGAAFGNLLPQVRLNDAGTAAFKGLLAGGGVTPTNDSGIWSGPVGGLQLVAREGDPAPTLPGGVLLGELPEPVLGDGGHLAFVSPLAGAGVNASNDSALWSGTPGAMFAVVREGDAAPGTAPGTSLAAFTTAPRINSAGRIALVATLGGGATTAANDESVWVGAPGALALAAREGDAAPGLPAGVAIASFPAAPHTPLAINAAGQIALRGTVAGPGITSANNDALWVGTAGALSLVIHEGDPAPELPPGIVIADNFPGASALGDAVLNGQGQVAFLATLAGPGVTFQNDTVLLATEPDGALRLIARTGEWFDVGGGDLRQIFSITLFTGNPLGSSGGDDGLPVALSDAGELAFRLTFVGGASGLYIAQVPEPSSWLLGALGGAALVALRRRRRERA